MPLLPETADELPAHPAGLSARAESTIQDILSGRSTTPPGLFGRVVFARGLFALAGPAIVASVAYVDPGNYVTNIQAGARYGYGLLWVVLLANLIAMVFQGLSARLGIVSGRNLAELCRERYPTAAVIPMWLASEMAAMATMT